jgi:hypothetical protein
VLPTPKRLAAPEQHPYRDTCVSDDLTEQATASHLAQALQFIDAFADNTILEWAFPDQLYENQVSKIYYAAREYGEAAYYAGYQSHDLAWHIAGEIVKRACIVVQKWAASSDGNGHVPNIMLQQAAQKALEICEFDAVSDVLCRWRFRDAYEGFQGAEAEQARQAFEACWTAGSYQLAYTIFETPG